MSDYDRIDLRKIVLVEGLERPYLFTASAFCGPQARVINADPVEILAVTTRHTPGYKSEPIGSKLTQYRFKRLLEQDKQCPVVMPSIGVSYHGSDPVTLYDTALVQQMIEKGVQRMPFCLMGLDEPIETFLKKCRSADASQSLEDVYRPSFQPDELSNVKREDFTTAFHMEEMIHAIDAHYSRCATKDSLMSQPEFYAAFPQCYDLLDVLIASGCQYTTPDRYWDGESILTSMEDHLRRQKLQIGSHFPSALELIDRFALLHERKIVKDKVATTSYMNVIEQDGETNLHHLSRQIAGMIASNAEALDLSRSELSDSAQSYLKSFAQVNERQIGMRPDIKP